jgi:hypothetical protein
MGKPAVGGYILFCSTSGAFAWDASYTPPWSSNHMTPPIPNQLSPMANLCISSLGCQFTPLCICFRSLACPWLCLLPPLMDLFSLSHLTSIYPFPGVPSAPATSYAPSRTQHQFLPPPLGAIMCPPSIAPKTNDVTWLTVRMPSNRAQCPPK